MFDLLEQALADLAASGPSDDDCAHLSYDLLAYTLGFVAWERPRTHAVSPAEYAARWRTAVGKLDERQYPTIHRLLDSLTTVASATQFDGGLRRIIRSAQ